MTLVKEEGSQHTASAGKDFLTLSQWILFEVNPIFLISSDLLVGLHVFYKVLTD